MNAYEQQLRSEAASFRRAAYADDLDECERSYLLAKATWHDRLADVETAHDAMHAAREARDQERNKVRL